MVPGNHLRDVLSIKLKREWNKKQEKSFILISASYILSCNAILKEKN